MFTVVVPAFNAAWCIEDALKSISEQSLPAVQIIVVDDGSSDGTAEVVRSCCPQARLVSIENGGAAVARRVGIDLCQTDWVALCDSDDIWRADHLERKAALIENVPDAQLLFSDCYAFGSDASADYSLFAEAPPGWFEAYQKDVHGDFFRLDNVYKAVLEFSPLFVSGLAFRLDAYKRVGGFLDKYSRWVGEDGEFTRRFVALADVVVAGDRAQTWGYRRHGGNFSRVRWKNYYCKPRILREHLDLNVVPAGMQQEVEVEIVRSLGEAFDVAFWDACYNDARQIFTELPPGARTVKRRIRAMIAGMRAGGSPAIR